MQSDIRPIHYHQLKKGMKITYKKGGETKRSEVMLRARKVAMKKDKGKAGKYEHFWNLKDPQTGHITVENTEELEEISFSS